MVGVVSPSTASVVRVATPVGHCISGPFVDGVDDGVGRTFWEPARPTTHG